MRFYLIPILTLPFYTVCLWISHKKSFALEIFIFAKRQFLELQKVVTLTQSQNEMAGSSLGRYRRVGVLLHFSTRSLFLGGNP